MNLETFLLCVAVTLWMWIIFRWGIHKFAQNMLFFPTKNLDDMPEKHNLPYEDVYLTTRDGKNIHGWYIPCENPIATILFFHGNAGNISHRLDEVALWHCIKVSVLMIDYRGYGKSNGKPSEIGLYLDAEAAYDFLTDEKKIPEEKIICFGRSLGGAVAVRLALSRKVGGLILASTFTSIEEMINTRFPGFISWIFRRVSPFKFRSKQLISYLEAPLLILHGCNDNLIPLEMAKELYNLAPSPKLLYPVAHADHNNVFIVGGKKYWFVIENFIKKSVNVLSK